MAKPEVFLDTNVVLDHFMDRQPFAEYAHRIFALAERSELRLHLSALSFCICITFCASRWGRKRPWPCWCNCVS